MSKRSRQTWRQNDYDPRQVETDDPVRRYIARAHKEAGAEQIVAEHNAFSELLEAAKLGAAYAKSARAISVYARDAERKIRAATAKAQRTEERR